MLKTGESLYFHCTLQKKKRIYLQLFLKLLLFIISRWWPQAISSSPPGQLSLPDSGSAAASCTNQRSAGSRRDGQRSRGREILKERERRRRWGTAWKREGDGEGGGEDHEVRSATWRGEAKNNSLIIHIQGFEVGDSQLLTGRQRLCSLELIRVRQRGGREAGHWIMWEQQAHPEISSISTTAAGWHREEENNETSHNFSKTGSR